MSGRIEIVRWRLVGEALPDSDTTVHIERAGEDGEPIWLGYHDGERWMSVDATKLDDVIAWAPMLGGTVAVPEGLGEFPAMSPELAAILGTLCFQCITFARALRTAGQEIGNRAEDEQAAVLHWMLGHYFRCGAEGWRKAAAEEMERFHAAALAAAAARAAKGGEA